MFLKEDVYVRFRCRKRRNGWPFTQSMGRRTKTYANGATSAPFFLGDEAYHHHIPAAVDHLVEITRRNRPWNDEAARKQLLQFFEAEGPTSDVTIAGRRKLSSVLFS